MSSHERKHMIRALQRYAEGLVHAGDYQLWVGFGDHWRGVREKMIKRGYLRPSTNGGVELSTKGSGFFDQIRSIAA